MRFDEIETHDETLYTFRSLMVALSVVSLSLHDATGASPRHRASTSAAHSACIPKCQRRTFVSAKFRSWGPQDPMIMTIRRRDIGRGSPSFGYWLQRLSGNRSATSLGPRHRLKSNTT